MTARSSPPSATDADRMRARIFRNPEAWRALQVGRPRQAREYPPAQFQITRDDWSASLEARDPRALEAELTHRRLRFWHSDNAAEVRLAARRAVQLNRHLDSRALVEAPA